MNQPEKILSYYNARRVPETHKGDYGRVYIAAGSAGMTGAAMLCAESALRAGAGLVYLLAPAALLPIYEIACKEAVKLRIGEEGDCYFKQSHVRQVLDAVKPGAGRSVFVIGPGLGSNNDTKQFVYGLLDGLCAEIFPVILDADGLNAYQSQSSRIAQYNAENPGGNMVLTPHTGELARLMGWDPAEINAHRIEAAQEAAARTGAVTVLKGSGTVIASPDAASHAAPYWINPTGNPGMATGGSGDVLSGILAGIFASDSTGASLYDLVRTGVYIHGLCGDLAAERYGERAVKAGDLIEMLKEVHRYGCQ